MRDNIRQYVDFKNMIKSNTIVELKIKIKDKDVQYFYANGESKKYIEYNNYDYELDHFLLENRKNILQNLKETDLPIRDGNYIFIAELYLSRERDPITDKVFYNINDYLFFPLDYHMRICPQCKEELKDIDDIEYTNVVGICNRCWLKNNPDYNKGGFKCLNTKKLVIGCREDIFEF